LNHVQGKLYKIIQDLRKTLVSLLEHLEGSLDFPDEIDPIDRKVTFNTFKSLHKDISHIIAMQDYGKVLTSGIECVLVGRPNVGKSSLFNALLGENRSIVTPIPGTTRDYIEGQINLKGTVIKLYDTAGLRKSNDYIEHLGMEKITELISKAHIVLWVIDQSEPLTEEDFQVYEKIKTASSLGLLVNKADAPSQIDTTKLSHIKFDLSLSVSAETKKGLSDLKSYFKHTFIDDNNSLELDIICNTRQQRCLEETLKHLETLIQLVQEPNVDDLLSYDLKHALLKLSEITGEEFTEELLDGIFSRFCVGK
jgi:tRNA modification GTPase